ncbi:MAG: DUF1015 family protein [Acidobacteriota bacterium]|nr:DUF1015 family protein [Acidobacteriota bacterium]
MRVRPFRALRPEPHVAAAVAAVPYDVVTTEEARELAAGSPLSFLHVTRAEIGLDSSVDPHDPAVYETARENLARLRQRAPLVVEAEPSLYVYRLRHGDHVQTGLAGCYALDDYEQGVIKKHERTRPEKEDDRTTHMVTVRAQTGVVFLTYRHTATLSERIDAVCAGAPLFDFEAPDQVRHTVWRAATPATANLVSAVEAVPALYIADGHHRAASAARARHALATHTVRTSTDTYDHDFFLAVAFPDDQTRILPYNRVVSELTGQTGPQFLDAISARLPVTPSLEATPPKGVVAMYLGGRWYHVGLNRERGSSADPASGLDAALLEEQVLAPVLDIRDIRTDPRVRFVGGVRGTGELARLVDSGEARVAFSLAPVTVSELLTVADSGGIMPPKSTWFEPKLRDGLLTHVI